MPLSRREFLAATIAAGAAAACGFFGDDGPERISYGDAPSQFGELYPRDDARGTVVLVHGGSWEQDTDLKIVRPMARDLHREGYTVWNVEYRRMGEEGGGWPGTFDDVGAAIDHVAEMANVKPVTPNRVIVVGHSAGGTLALWSASNYGAVQPVGFVSLAGVTDLEACLQLPALAPACTRLLGGTPDQAGTAYAEASPIELLPTGQALSLVHGEDDEIVPIAQSVTYARAARNAGDRADLVQVPNAGHFQLIDIHHPAYGEVLTAIDNLLPNPA